MARCLRVEIVLLSMVGRVGHTRELERLFMLVYSHAGVTNLQTGNVIRRAYIVEIRARFSLNIRSRPLRLAGRPLR